tara:strand:+ start:1692 stop:2213 length:522 start_codon:yes stop_codon:yes gene_type:complete
MSRTKALNAIETLTEMSNKSSLNNDEELLFSLLIRYAESQDKSFWNAVKAMAHVCNLQHILGVVPYAVEKRIRTIQGLVTAEAEQYYYKMKMQLGFIPFNVRQRRILDRDDPAANEAIQGDSLALTQGNAVRRSLLKFYREGTWDGQEETIGKAFQKHREIFMEGCYTKEDYY